MRIPCAAAALGCRPVAHRRLPMSEPSIWQTQSRITLNLSPDAHIFPASRSDLGAVYSAADDGHATVISCLYDDHTSIRSRHAHFDRLLSYRENSFAFFRC